MHTCMVELQAEAYSAVLLWSRGALPGCAALPEGYSSAGECFGDAGAMQGRCGTCWTGLIWGYTALSVQCSSTVVQE